MQNWPKIALGTWSWGSGAAGGDTVFGNHLSDTEMAAVFDAGMDAGLNLWDTAPVYGMGSSETILGRQIARAGRENVIISTKFTPNIADSTAAYPMQKMLDGSLARLNSETADIYWIHSPKDVERFTPMLIPLLELGKVKHVGVSNHNLEQIKRANEILQEAGFALSAVQNHFSLLYRSSEDGGILQYCHDNGIAFFAYMVLEQGALTGRYHPENPMPEGSMRAETYNPLLENLQALTDFMAKIGEKYGLTAAQAAIAYAIAKGTVPLIGATQPHHATDAAKAAGAVLTADEVRALEEKADAVGVDTRGRWEEPMD